MTDTPEQILRDLLKYGTFSEEYEVGEVIEYNAFVSTDERTTPTIHTRIKAVLGVEDE